MRFVRTSYLAAIRISRHRVRDRRRNERISRKLIGISKPIGVVFICNTVGVTIQVGMHCKHLKESASVEMRSVGIHADRAGLAGGGKRIEGCIRGPSAAAVDHMRLAELTEAD